MRTIDIVVLYNKKFIFSRSSDPKLYNKLLKKIKKMNYGNILDLSFSFMHIEFNKIDNLEDCELNKFYVVELKFHTAKYNIIKIECLKSHIYEQV